MRKSSLFYFFFSVIMVFALVSCYGRNRLELLVDKMNEECPVSAGVIGEVTGFEIEDNNVLVTLMVNENILNVEALKSNPDLMHNNIMIGFQNPTPEMEELVDELRRCKAGLAYRYVGNVSGEEATVSLTSDEIKSLSKSRGFKDPDAVLDAQISVTNAQLPMQLDEMTVMTKLLREDDCLVYCYDVDENLLTLDDLDASGDFMEQMLIDELRVAKDRPESKQFFEACKLADVDIAYRYRGTLTGRTIQYIVPIDSI